MTPSTRPGTRHRARRRQILAPGVRADARGRGSPESAVVPNREGAAGALDARHPGAPVVVDQGPQHQVARALSRGARGNAARMPARPRRARTREAFRRRRQDRRARRDGGREDRAGHTRRAAAGRRQAARDRGRQVARRPKGFSDPARTPGTRTGSAAYCSNRARNSSPAPTSLTPRPPGSCPSSAGRGR